MKWRGDPEPERAHAAMDRAFGRFLAVVLGAALLAALLLA